MGEAAQLLGHCEPVTEPRVGVMGLGNSGDVRAGADKLKPPT